MAFSKIACILASASMVAGHGYVSGVVANGQYYGGYIVDTYAYNDNAPDTIAWSTQATDLGFVSPDSYSSPDIICHEDAKPGALTASVKAGSKIEMQWTEWPESHHGPILNYLAPCNGDCSKVDKTSLKFFKIDQQGLIDGSNPPGTWASDNMIENNNTYTFTMPEAVPDGNYVLRHELIALHSAGQENGAQNYVQCVNVKVTGGGNANPTGTAGEQLYKASDKGIKFDIYSDLSSYPVPGPALFNAN
ncbi:lytic polysaccharide monooxygenase auxiliary activity family 9 protein [Aspergillus chevalieri]|uniref:Auxiliary Activity family 9 catalytic domain-containing protein n=1 Tax=Aspergillus chevalieri TaxID=182096 RepID=A0A7R7VWB9_ASPCH|nr:uncharacterized protein ACHE_70794A [Aspergillus chevalieri]BCR91951.1 hypothetical protein ACHE_70794A [Aspergillus chevalieri]